jgi:hypothetical protein
LCPESEKAGIAVIEIAHERVTRGLGENRSRADRRHGGVTLDDGFEKALEPETVRAGTAIAVDETCCGGTARPNKARRMASMVACRILMLSISSASPTRPRSTAPARE